MDILYNINILIDVSYYIINRYLKLYIKWIFHNIYYTWKGYFRIIYFILNAYFIFFALVSLLIVHNRKERGLTVKKERNVDRQRKNDNRQI